MDLIQIVLYRWGTQFVKDFVQWQLMSEGSSVSYATSCISLQT